MKLFISRFFIKSPIRVAISIATILLLTGSLLVFHSRSEIFSEDEDEANPDRPDMALLQDIERTKDLSLGYVPRERLLHVLNVINQQNNSNNIQSLNWSERGPNNVGGRTRALMFDPNDGSNGYKKVWAGGTGGGLWYTNDITAVSPAWNNVDDFWANLAVSTIAYDPSNTNTFYVGTGEGWFNSDAIQGAGIWKTSDGGSTWSQLSATNNSNFYYIQKIVVAGNGNVFASTRTNGIYLSTDGGTSWTKVLGSGVGASTNRAADIEIGADGTIYATMGIFSTDGIYSSSTGTGGSWTKLNIGSNGFPTSGFYRIEIACAPSDANTLYAMACSSSSGNPLLNIYKSTDKGSNWTALGLPTWCDQGNSSSDMTRGQSWYDLVLAVSPSSASTVYAGGVDIMKSTDGGNTFSQITRWSSFGGCSGTTIHADQHAFTFQPGSSSVAVAGNDGGIYYTSNGGTSFSSKNNSYDVTQFYSCAMQPGASTNYYLAGAQDNGSQKFTSSGINSTTQPTGGDGAFCFIDQDNPNYQITSYVYNNFYLSTNGGTSFGTLTSDNNGSFINPADYDDVNNILYSGYSTGNLFRVTNITGTPSSGTISISGMTGSATHIRVSPNTASTVFLGTDAGKIYKIANANSTPSTTDISGTLPSGSISCIEVGATDNDLIVTYSNYGLTSVWRTTNGGGTWSSREGNLPDMPVRWALTDPGNSSHVIIATEVGVWETTDITVSSPTWSAFLDFPNVRVDMLQTRSSDNEVIAATHGRGLYSSSTVFASGSAPVANFSGTPTSLCAGGTVSFSDLSTNTPTTWAWTFTGGTPSTSSSQNPTITYNTPGTYAVSLTATNSSGSDTKTVNAYVTVYSNPSSSASVTNVTCHGGNNGTIDLTPSGGSSPYIFLWNPSGQTTEDRNSLTAQTYSVTITDNNGCTVLSTYTVTQPVILSAAMSKTDASCANNDGTATATPSGGTAPYTYAWSPGGQITQTATGLSAATYSCTVTDSHGCVISGNINLVISGCGPTQLTTATCGITLTSLNQQIYCNAVSGAIDYRYRLVCAAQGFNQIFSRGSSATNFYFNWATGIQYGRTYNVDVSAKIGSTWSAFGTVCTITTPASMPLTQLTPATCGIILTALNQQVYCNPMINATDYKYRIINAAQGYNQIVSNGSSATNFYFNWAPGIQYGRTYTVEVSSYVGGIWSAFGPICNVTTPATVPNTQVSAPNCPGTLAAVSSQILCTAVPGATNYQWKVVNASLGYSSTLTRGGSANDWHLNWNGGILVNTTYSISISSYVNGVWSSFGPVCSVTTGPVPFEQNSYNNSKIPSEVLNANPGLSSSDYGYMNIFPNPAQDQITVIVLGTETKFVDILNAIGERVGTAELIDGKAEINISDLPQGIYLVQVKTEEGIIIKKLIK